MKTIIVILASLLILPAVCSAQEGDLAAEVRELRAKLERLEKKMTDEEAQKMKRAEAERAALTEQVKKESKPKSEPTVPCAMALRAWTICTTRSHSGDWS